MRDEMILPEDQQNRIEARRQEGQADILVGDLEERLGLFPGSAETGIALTRAAMRRVLRFSGETEFIRYVGELTDMIDAEKDAMLADALRNFDDRLQ